MRRKFYTFRRLMGYGIRNFVRNAWLSVAATAVMIVALTIMLSAIVLNITAKNAIKELSKDIKVSIYFQEGITAADREKLRQALVADPVVADVEYITRAKAKARFQEDQTKGFLDQSLALAGEDALPESFDVSVTDLDKLQEVANIAKRSEFKDIVGQNSDDITLGKTRSKETIDRAASAKRLIIISSVVAAAIFSVVSFLIIFNTIRMAIFTRSEEIHIMKLIGATPDYIRGPFLIEACMYGLIAGLAATAVVCAGIFSLGGKLADQREFAATYSLFASGRTVLMMLAGAILVGVLIAIFSSLTAMEKYLRLKRW